MLSKAPNEFKDYHSLKFPCSRQEYCSTVGKEGQQFYQTLLQEILAPFHPGVIVFSCPTQGNGPDLVCVKGTKAIAKFEVLNWHVKSLMRTPRANRIKENLKGVRFKAILGTIPLREKPWNNVTPKARKILRRVLPILQTKRPRVNPLPKVAWH